MTQTTLYLTWPLSDCNWLSDNMCNECSMPAGNAYPWIRTSGFTPFRDFHMFQLLWFSDLLWVYRLFTSISPMYILRFDLTDNLTCIIKFACSVLRNFISLKNLVSHNAHNYKQLSFIQHLSIRLSCISEKIWHQCHNIRNIHRQSKAVLMFCKRVQCFLR